MVVLTHYYIAQTKLFTTDGSNITTFYLETNSATVVRIRSKCVQLESNYPQLWLLAHTQLKYNNHDL